MQEMPSTSTFMCRATMASGAVADAHGVGAQGPEGANLGRRLVTGAEDGDVDAVLEPDAARRCGVARQAAQAT